MEKQTGGPAFPKLSQDERWKTFSSTDGMTLRDYFAAKALQSIIGKRNGYLSTDVRYAYEVADAMLKAREQ